MMSMTGWAIFFVTFLAAYLIYDHFKTKRINRDNPEPDLVKEQLPQLSEEEINTENHVRHNWWIAFVTYTIWTIASTVYQMIDNHFTQEPVGEEEMSTAVVFGINVFSVFFCLFFAWLTYHCAYKKRGTAWLTFLLVIYTLAFVLTAILYLSPALPPEITADLFTPLMITQTVIGIIAMLYFGVNCYRLRQVNALRKKKGV